MKMKMVHLVVVLLVLFFFAGPMYAHHGTAAYDTEKALTLRGAVASFEFINPHAEIRVAVTDEKGHRGHRRGKTNHPNRFGTRRWDTNFLKASHRISVVGN